MPEITGRKIVSKIKPELITDLNIVLSKQQIDLILKEMLADENIAGGLVALASDYCCVDGSVGSSVAGPVSSVGSSISVDPNIKNKISQRLTADKVRVNIMVPQEITIR